MDETAFQHSYSIQDHCKDVQIPIKQAKNIHKNARKYFLK